MTMDKAFYSVIIRGVTFASRFILLMYLVKSLSPSDYGEYGIFVACITISLYIVGLDFYTFNSREILAVTADKQVCFIRDQFIFHLLNYVATLPLLIFIFVFGFIKWEYILWFYTILILEHLAHELYRIFITLSKPIIANILLFLRIGSWVYILAALNILGLSNNNLSFVWQAWFLGNFSSFVLGIYLLKEMPWKNIKNNKIDWQWLKKGLNNTWIFFGATLCFSGVRYADRFFIQQYLNSDLLGVYTFYVTVAGISEAFVYTGIVSIYFPNIVKAYQKEKIRLYRQLLYKMSWLVIGATVVLSLIAFIITPYIIKLIQKPVYESYMDVFFIVLLSSVMYAISNIPHYVLYAQKKDKNIFLSQFFSLLVTILAELYFIRYGIMGAAWGSLIGFTTIFLFKTFYSICQNEN